MNTKKNQKFLKTEEKMIEVFVSLLECKEPEKITVSEICQVCGINRSSFYLHFTDVFDMMDKIEERLALYYGYLFTEPNESYSLRSRFCRLFEFIREHRNFYRAYLGRKSAVHVLDAILPESASASMLAMAEALGFADGHVIHYHQTFFKAGLAALISEWIRQDCRESPEEMVRMDA